VSTVEYAGAHSNALSRADLHQTWWRRAQAARQHRRRFEKQWMESQMFAAGQQHAEYNTRTHRVLVPDETQTRKKQTDDVLMQYVWTVIGALAADDFRPQFLATREGVEADDRADYVNKALSYGWEEEWDGDALCHETLLNIATYGTAAIRCRYDRSRGALISEQNPYVNGEPVLGDERARVMESRFSNGQPVQMAPLREGQVVWDALSVWNLLPPPGVKQAREFPWEIVVRPVHIEDLRQLYPEQAKNLRPEALESMDVLGFPKSDDGRGGSGKSGSALEEHVLVYTGYQPPGATKPNGETAVFTSRTLLGEPIASEPYPSRGGRPDSSGVTYFRYWPVPGRFWGRGFIEPGMGPQRTLNKRVTQIDEIIDRGMPYVLVTESTSRRMKIPDGLPMQIVVIPDPQNPPAPQEGIGPGQWMDREVDRLEQAVANALGVKQVALGENPPGTSNYSQLALLKDSEATKLGLISQALQIGLAKVATDSIEAMRRWPAGKKLLIVGEENKLEGLEWDKGKIPDEFLIRPAKKGPQPRGVGAELAKVNDIWLAAVNSQAVARNPIAWLDWYVRSLEASKTQPLPDEGSSEQLHRAALENLAMQHSGQTVPVAPYDNTEIHLPEHDRAQEQLSETAMEGDQQAIMAINAIEQHKQAHLAQAQQAAASTAGQQGALPPGAGGSPAVAAGAAGAQPPSPPGA
jgi:hypothetical protein